MSLLVFTPRASSSILAATTASASVNLFPNGGTNSGPASWNIAIANQSAAWAYVVFGTSTVTAVLPTAGNPQPGVAVPPNSVVITQLPYKDTYAAAILTTGTGNIIFTPCLGG
jgi:hypothetical protein